MDTQERAIEQNKSKKQLILERKAENIATLKEWIIESGEYSGDKRHHLKKLAESLAKKQTGKAAPEFKELSDEFLKQLPELKAAYTLHTKHHLARVVSPRDFTAALQMCEELEQEFSATSSSEKALVEVAVVTYMRMHAAMEHYNASSNPEFYTNESTSLMNAYAKEIDRAHKHFLSTIQTLKQLKQQPMNIQINTQTAFIADKQQNIANN